MTLATAAVLASIPSPSTRRLALRVTPAAQHALRSGHPWLFEQAITTPPAQGQPGDLAVVFDDQRRFLAIGLYDPTSVIRVRVLHHGAPTAINQAWFAAQLSAAAARRAALPAQGATGYRLVHGENDGLPGLVIDRYDTILVLKLYTVAWIPHLPTVLAALAEAAPAQGVVLRLSRELLRQPAFLFGLHDGVVLAGDLADPAVRFTENGLQFEANVLHGQKTGFFFDQRDNRARVAALAVGRRTLNVFAYSGGFSLYAAAGGAPSVLSLDLSAPALAAAVRNFELNQHLPLVAAAAHTVLAADAFDALAALRQRGQRFDLVIVDPPALAKQEREVSGALQAYRRLTHLALGVLAPAGTLMMASCSSRVSALDFYATVEQAAVEAGRPLQIFARSGHAADHPIGFAAGAYLKAFFASVR